MWFGVVTLFPDMFDALKQGITGRALKESLLSLHFTNPRDFATDKHRSVDDRPYGGGPGMVMMAEPLTKAIQANKALAPQKPLVVYLSPQGKAFDQAAAERFLQAESVLLVAGRYEGIDERVIEQEIDEEWSIGDYILSGGELAAMVMIDAVTRLIPGALGDENSVTEDSLSTGLLKYPQYTRPDNFEGRKVPEVLMGGHHQEIARWRRQQSLARTWLRRRDLLDKQTLSKEDLALLQAFLKKSLPTDGGG